MENNSRTLASFINGPEKVLSRGIIHGVIHPRGFLLMESSPSPPYKEFAMPKVSGEYMAG
jgi:hypothetical protein